MGPENPVVVSAKKVLDEFGLRYSVTMGKAIVLEGGFSDSLRALKVPTVSQAITGGSGFINGPIAQRNMLPARRALLAHIVEILKERGATLKKKEEHHGPTVDETYHLVVEGIELDLVLMPN
jgi:hypothetical protein